MPYHCTSVLWKWVHIRSNAVVLDELHTIPKCMIDLPRSGRRIRSLNWGYPWKFSKLITLNVRVRATETPNISGMYSVRKRLLQRVTSAFVYSPWRVWRYCCGHAVYSVGRRQVVWPHLVAENIKYIRLGVQAWHCSLVAPLDRKSCRWGFSNVIWRGKRTFHSIPSKHSCYSKVLTKA